LVFCAVMLRNMISINCRNLVEAIFLIERIVMLCFEGHLEAQIFGGRFTGNRPVINKLLDADMNKIRPAVQALARATSIHTYTSRGSSVGIAVGCRLDDRGVGVSAPLGSRILSSPQR
jgi:hypothetical protein